MFCGKCGRQNDDNAKFCIGCGQPLNAAAPAQAAAPVNAGAPAQAAAPVNATAPAQGAAPVNAGAPAQGAAPVNAAVQPKNAAPKKQLPVKTLIIAAAAAVAFIIAIVVIAIVAINAGKTINLDKYLTIEASGYDGYGNAKVTIDWDAIEAKYGKKLSFTAKAKKEYGDWLSLTSPMELLESYVSVSLEQYNNLSNDMEVAYTWNVDEELKDYVKCKVKYKDSTYVVSGLEEIGTFDAFEDLSVSFTGTAPNGCISMEYTGSELSYYDFQASQIDGLCNGDTVTITINGSDMSYYAQNLGKVPASLEKQYTVEGLPEYVGSYASLTEDFLNNAKSEAEDSIYAYAANSYNTATSLTDLQYAGYVFDYIKDGSGYVNYYNDLYVIYTGTVSNSEGSFAATKVYFPVRFTNILLADGTLSYEDNRGVCGSTYFGNSWYSTRGYINPLICYMEIVEANRDYYTAECGDGFEVYAEYETISQLSDISEEYKQALYADAQDQILSYIANSYNGGSTATDLAVKGEYLLLAKTQGTDFRNNNRYVVVYSATVSNSQGKFETTTVYFPVEYDGIVKLPGDEYMTTASVGMLGYSTFADSWYNTKGYIDGTQMYSDIVTSNRENYTYEVSEGLTEFGN